MSTHGAEIFLVSNNVAKGVAAILHAICEVSLVQSWGAMTRQR
jgi:hypothetical protein